MMSVPRDAHAHINDALCAWFCPLLKRITQDIRGFDGATFVFMRVVFAQNLGNPSMSRRYREGDSFDRIRISFRVASDTVEGRMDTAVIVSEVVTRLLYVFHNELRDPIDIRHGSVGIILSRASQQANFITWEQFSENPPDITNCALRNQSLVPVEEVQAAQKNAQSLAEVVAMFTSEEEHTILLGALDAAIRDVPARLRTLTWQAEHASSAERRERAALTLVGLEDAGPYLSAALVGLRSALGENVPSVDMYKFAKRKFGHA
jgi:hypothetical protein